MNKNEEKFSGDVVIDIEESELSSVTEEDIDDFMNPLSVFETPDITDRTAFLWQYKPVPENEPEPFEEYISSEAEFDGGRITAGRVRGKKHKHDGTNCDDWFEYDVSGEWKIMLVSDGAGSRKFSRIGAKESCRSALEFLKNKLSSAPHEMKEKLSAPLDDEGFIEGCGYFASLLQESAVKAKEAVESAFEERKSKYDYLNLIGRDLELKDFSGTFLACIVIPVNTGERTEYFAAALQIGDGIICSVNCSETADRALRLLSTPDSGEYSGETDFITSANQTKKETLMGKTKIMRGAASAFMLMTDGVADDYFPNSPELLRLYLDLRLNGIAGTADEKKTDDSGVEAEVSVPEPVMHPWVNDNSKKIPVQYSKRIYEKTGDNLETLWGNEAVIEKASLDVSGPDYPEKRSGRLLRWLDNYTERGSFDDRTLVICEMIQE